MKEIFMRFPGGLAKTLTFSYDDAVWEDIRLTEIFKKHRLKATFNINSGLFTPKDTEPKPGQIGGQMPKSVVKSLYADELFEVACHSVDHPFLDNTDPAVAFGQIVYDRRNLEALFGVQVHGMAYPMGTYNDTVVEMCRAAGIHYARTVTSTHSFDLPKEWLTLHPTCHHADPRLMELAETFTRATYRRHPQMFYVWGHAYEFHRDDNWHIIEDFAAKMAGHEDIWYATNDEIYGYCCAYGRLRFSADGLIVYNPTATDLWYGFENGQTAIIRAGETVRL